MAREHLSTSAPVEDQRRVESTGDQRPTSAETQVSSGRVEENDDGVSRDSRADINMSSGSFDLKSLRLSSNFADDVSVERVITSIPVRKPTRNEFVRTHTDREKQFRAALLEDPETREIYVVEHAMQDALRDYWYPALLWVAVNRQGVSFLWPLKLPRDEGRPIAWHESASAAAHLAMSNWVQVHANMSTQQYDVRRALGNLEDPEWSELTMEEILRLAFQGRMIATMDHPVVQRLRGVV